MGLGYLGLFGTYVVVRLELTMGLRLFELGVGTFRGYGVRLWG